MIIELKSGVPHVSARCRRAVSTAGHRAALRAIRPAASATPLVPVSAPVPFPMISPFLLVGAVRLAPYNKVVPPIPFADTVWIAGYCSYLGGRHRWEPRRWEALSPGYSYRLPTWDRMSSANVFFNKGVRS